MGVITDIIPRLFIGYQPHIQTYIVEKIGLKLLITVTPVKLSFDANICMDKTESECVLKKPVL